MSRDSPPRLVRSRRGPLGGPLLREVELDVACVTPVVVWRRISLANEHTVVGCVNSQPDDYLPATRGRFGGEHAVCRLDARDLLLAGLGEGALEEDVQRSLAGGSEMMIVRVSVDVPSSGLSTLKPV